MKQLKKYFGIILGIIMTATVMPVIPAYASGNVIVAVSASSLNIGDTVTVTATAKGPGGEQTTATLGFSYDSSKLSFVSCSESTYSGGGGGFIGVVGEKASITLKAEAAGSASLKVSGSDGVIFDTGEEIGELAAGGTTVTVNNAAGGTGNTDTSDTSEGTPADNSNKSADNSLATLTISPGTLSPAFQSSTTNYTANVGSEVNEIAVDAKVSNSKATVESVTGNTNLQAGQNTVKIVVKAENGTTAVYKIVVTKGGAAQQPAEEPDGEEPTGEENPEAIIINGHEYNLAETIADDKVLEDFAKTTISCKGKEIEALQFNNGNVVLVYLTTPDTEVKNTFAVYEQESGEIYPFVKIAMGNGYYILLNAPAETGLPDTYAATTVEMGEYGAVAAYGAPETEEFCLLYAVSKSGNTGWYQYDKSEGTLQRYIQQEAETAVDEEAVNAEIKALQDSYDKLEKEYDKEKGFTRKITAVLLFLIAVLIVVIVNLILRKRDNEEDWEEEVSEEPKQRVSKKSPEEKQVKGQEERSRESKEKPREPKEKPREPEEKDDFEVIDLDDL